MKVEQINTNADAQRFVEGAVNDFESGLSTKDELLSLMGSYTGRLMDLFWESSKKIIRENPDLLK